MLCRWTIAPWIGVLLIAAAWLGCGDGSGGSYAYPPSSTTGGGGQGAGGGIGGDGGGIGGDGGGTSGLGVGEPCTGTDQCRAGLVCDEGHCAPGHSTVEGDPCTISAECAPDLYCADGECAPAGSGTDHHSCGSDADCASGYRCMPFGLSALCVPEGSIDVGGSCQASTDCFGALACIEGACAVVAPGTPPFGPLWPGIDCEDDSYPVQAHFRVPRGVPEDGDFYRLPMPNDVRLDAGQIDLSGHPTPGDALLGYDLVDRYLRAIEQDNDGWGVNHVTTFRFSAPIDWDTVEDHVHMVDLTQGWGYAYYYQFVTSRNAYACGNRFNIGPLQGWSYRHGHTYAAYLDIDIKADNGSDIERAADLEAMLANTAPADPDLAPHWPKYQSFRAYLAAQAIDPATVLTATVFTVGQPADLVEQLATDIAAAAPPTATDWTLCDDGVPSPCPDATGPRACPTADPDFDELHALVSLPIFQEGTAPYLTPADGGAIATDAGGQPIVTSTEQICLSLAVPKAAPPPGGWPTIVYAHGTGGHFRSHVVLGIADDFALGVDDGTGSIVQAAVLGIDQVAHGPRAAGSPLPAHELTLNFGNPAAARGNPQQSAADQLSLLRLVPTVSFDAVSSPTGAAFDLAGPPAFWGHGLGATAGGIATAYDDWLGLMFSGAAASQRNILVTRQSPMNTAAILPWVLGDPGGSGLLGGANHPVLSWLQTYLDPADPVAYGRLLVSAPPSGVTPHHLFQVLGLDDTTTPPIAQAHFAASAGAELAAHDPSVTTPEEIGYPPLQPLGTPLSGNRLVQGTTVTAAVRQYAPAAGDDGHLVVLDVATAHTDAERYLAGVLGGIMPRVGE